MRLKQPGNSMIECLVALVVMSVGLIGLTELSVQRLQQINTTQQLITLLGIAADTALLTNMGESLPNTNESPINYTAKIEQDSSTPIGHIVVTGEILSSANGHVALRLPVYSSRAPLE